MNTRVLADWTIDTSAGRPILMHKKCSVIEAEDAEYVMCLIAADLAPRTGRYIVSSVAFPSMPRMRIFGKSGKEYKDGDTLPASDAPFKFINFAAGGGGGES
jgi:hypothetical protein